MLDGFNNDNFDLKLPIAKIKLCQIKVLYSVYLVFCNLIGHDIIPYIGKFLCHFIVVCSCKSENQSLCLECYDK